MQDIIIVGASGFGREVLALIESINEREPTWNVQGFIDDNLNALEGFNIPYKVLGRISDWQPSQQQRYALAIAAPKTKEKVVSVLQSRGAIFETLVSPTAKVGKRVKLGKGIILFEFTNISVDATIGDYVFINSQSGVGHDSNIGDYCTIGPKVSLSGYTNMGKCVNVGALASTYPGVKVGDYATIGMNSCAIRTVKAGTTVIGVPAKTMF